MAESVTFAPPVTGSEAPAAPAAPLVGTEKALADTKAELTRVQQELAALKKPAAPADAAATPAATPPADAPADAPADKPAGAEGGDGKSDDPDTKAAADAVASVGLDVTAWQTEFNETGDVAEDGRTAIADALKEKFGEDARALVDQFIEGRKAIVANQRSELYAAGGGEDGYKEMLGWAKTALTPKEAQQFDAAVTSGDHNAALFAIKGLRSRFENVNGKEPSLLGGGGAPSAPAGFASTFEMTAAMRDPRYGKDPAYTKEVEQRTMRSNF